MMIKELQEEKEKIYGQLEKKDIQVDHLQKLIDQQQQQDGGRGDGPAGGGHHAGGQQPPCHWQRAPGHPQRAACVRRVPERPLPEPGPRDAGLHDLHPQPSELGCLVGGVLDWNPERGERRAIA